MDFAVAPETLDVANDDIRPTPYTVVDNEKA